MFEVYYWIYDEDDDCRSESVAYTESESEARHLSYILNLAGYETEINKRKCWPSKD